MIEIPAAAVFLIVLGALMMATMRRVSMWYGVTVVLIGVGLWSIFYLLDHHPEWFGL